MEEIILSIAKGLGISHFNAALIAIFILVVLKGFKSLTKAYQELAKALNGMSTDIKVTNTWCQQHDKEDERRFDEVHRRLGERRLL